jgi:hypothetical protein
MKIRILRTIRTTPGLFQGFIYQQLNIRILSFKMSFPIWICGYNKEHAKMIHRIAMILQKAGIKD